MGENLIEKVAQWLDTAVIATAILEEMEEQEVKPNLSYRYASKNVKIIYNLTPL